MGRARGGKGLQATRSSEFPQEDFLMFIDFGCVTGRFIPCFPVITLVSIVRLFTPKKYNFSNRRRIVGFVVHTCGV